MLDGGAVGDADLGRGGRLEDHAQVVAPGPAVTGYGKIGVAGTGEGSAVEGRLDLGIEFLIVDTAADGELVVHLVGQVGVEVHRLHVGDGGVVLADPVLAPGRAHAEGSIEAEAEGQVLAQGQGQVEVGHEGRITAIDAILAQVGMAGRIGGSGIIEGGLQLDVVHTGGKLTALQIRQVGGIEILAGGVL